MSDLYLYGDIGYSFWDDNSITADSVMKQLAGLGNDRITVHINSPGGDVFEGVTIYNLLKRRGVDVVVDGLAASAASLIAMAGNTVTMGTGTMMMIHDPWTLAIGNAAEMQKTASMLEEVTASLIDIYHDKTRIAKDHIRSLLAAETWMTALAAVEQGFSDVVAGDGNEALPMNLSRPWIRAAPPDDAASGMAFRVAAHRRRHALNESGQRPLRDWQSPRAPDKRGGPPPSSVINRSQ